ncbi:RNA polymerase subunit sigma-70 [Dermatobacter hominis]|uniref:RNA polymerase subunit sigma-70 n=1 Tax=Dermatobacter hominis TaxID=2884263 RepID=UPI001D110EEA|nr:RNA polymerase subunit sigma-70 [Dermatobacter hominis]UDY34920.1 RNA polymerase subunit sigma-70 [Dermatobacter hominis]
MGSPDETIAVRMDESVLDRARAGDDDAFELLVGPHRRELLVHCYRSLGSVQDAEDVLQEVMVAAWRALDRFDGRSLRAWLYRIATNRCLNHVRDASRRPRAAEIPAWAGVERADDPWWLEPFPDAWLEPASEGPEARYDDRESIGLSFVAGLQALPAQQRAALVLRDVLGFPAAEAAEILGSSVASVNSALVRARAGFRPGRTPDRIPLPRTPEAASLVDRFVHAFQQGDTAAVVDLLSDDVRLSMPPEPIQCDGTRAVVAYLRARGFWGPGLQVVPTAANGQPAFGYYLPDPASDRGRLHGLIVLTVSDRRVTTITRFGGVDIEARFVLPSSLPPSDDAGARRRE